MPLHIKPNHMYTNLIFFEEEHQNISNMLTKLTLIELKNSFNLNYQQPELRNKKVN